MEVFQTLGVARVRPLFAEMGIPRPMAEAPGVLLEVAADLVTAIRTEAHVNSLAAGDSLERHLDAVFRRLSDAYGDSAATALRRWAEERIVDGTRRHTWWLWQHLLRDLARLRSRGRAGEVGLSEDRLEQIERVVERHLGAEPTAALAERLAVAARTPISPREMELLAIERAASDARGHPDVLRRAEEEAGKERASRAWQELRAVLDEEERRSIIDWGIAKMTSEGVQAEKVRID